MCGCKKKNKTTSQASGLSRAGRLQAARNTRQSAPAQAQSLGNGNAVERDRAKVQKLRRDAIIRALGHP
jgi:hypothetical protein